MTPLQNFDRTAAFRTITKRLRWLMAFETSPEFSLARWAWEKRKLDAFIAKRALEMDEVYWHYMSDVDIRQRDGEAAYAAAQRDSLFDLIKTLESEHSSANV